MSNSGRGTENKFQALQARYVPMMRCLGMLLGDKAGVRCLGGASRLAETMLWLCSFVGGHEQVPGGDTSEHQHHRLELVQNVPERITHASVAESMPLHGRRLVSMQPMISGSEQYYAST